MSAASRTWKAPAQGVLLLVVFALLISRAVSSNISHDENQFIAPGQLLAYEGRLPYVDYPYTHMPYAIPLYALSALVSEYDLLAGRLFSAIFWLGSIVLLVLVGRSLSGQAGEDPSWKRLLWEFALVLAWLHDPAADFVLGSALNHSQAVLCSMLALLLFVRATRQAVDIRAAAFWSGAWIAVAGLTRFNYASLAFVLLAGWMAHGIQLRPTAWKALMGRFGAGAVLAGLPAMGLAALAPRQFYFANAVYIRLNTLYYEAILHRAGMDLASKLSGVGSLLLADPMQMLMYAVLLYTLVAIWINARRSKSGVEIARVVVAASAVTMFLTAFAPTPLLLQYLAAPLPFLIVLFLAFDLRVPRFEAEIRLAGALAVAVLVLLGVLRQNPVPDLAKLATPRDWPPIQLHELSTQVRQLVPAGRVLTLQAMVPLEAGLDVYPFAATGPFTWRISRLLTAERRHEYGLTGPTELPALLEQMPPDGILVGFEEPNPGFERNDMGGLETALREYAASHGYQSERLQPPFWSRGLTLWVRP